MEVSMLVLSRQRDEVIKIGDEIEITVVDIRGDKVRLGITAPTRVSVHRKEVYEAIKAENQRNAENMNAPIPPTRGPCPTTTGTPPMGPPRIRQGGKRFDASLPSPQKHGSSEHQAKLAG